jgi:hypothetical protein
MHSDEKEIYLKNIINDLILCLSMWIEDYPFDNNHISKQKDLINKAYRAIGTPISMEEMTVAIAWSK